MLYIQDEGSKELNKVYIDKNSGIMYKCIKATSNQSNTEEYFSRIDIGNIYDSQKHYVYYRNTNMGPFDEKYNKMIAFVSGDKTWETQVHYSNSRIDTFGNIAIFEIALAVNFRNYSKELRPKFPIDSWIDFNIDMQLLSDLLKFDKTIKATIGRGRATLEEIYVSSMSASETTDIPNIVMGCTASGGTISVFSGDLGNANGETNKLGYEYLTECCVCFTKVFSVK